MRAFQFCIVLALSMLAAAPAALGNGGYFPLQAVEAKPTIPNQRALIVHRDGVETLVVESMFQSDSPQVGWVLPLPAEPTGIAKADPGVLVTLARQTGPKLVHDIGFTAQGIAGLVLILLPAIALLASRRPARIGEAALYVLLAGVGVSCLLPSLGDGGAGIGEVDVSATQRVGSYDVSVLRADDPDALSRWLETNNLRPLDGQARAIVDDYIARGWCFAAARLARKPGGEPAAPHPLQVTFPAEAPVFPMKLTAIAGGTTQVDLYVIADGGASAMHFEPILRDRYKLKPAHDDKGPWLAAEEYSRIGLPDVANLAWDGCTVTHLRGRLAPAQMGQDVLLSIAPAEPMRLRQYTERYRRYAVGLVLAFGSLPLLLVMIRLIRKRATTRRWVIDVGVLVLLFGGEALAIRLLLPVVPAESVSQRHRIGLERDAYAMKNIAFRSARDESPVFHAELTDEQLAKQFIEILNRDGVEEPPMTESLPRFERSPGNFSIRREGDAVWLCTYGWSGNEFRVLLPPPPATTQPATSDAAP